MSQLPQKIEQLLQAGQEEEAVAHLKSAARQRCADPDIVTLFGLARSLDRNDLALALLGQLPTTRQNQLLAYILRYEMGEAIADPMAATLGEITGPDPMLLKLAAAYEAEGRGEEAVALVEGALQQTPGWLDGHRALAQFLWTSGTGDCTRSMRHALRQRPEDELLRASLLATLKSIEDHEQLAPLVDQSMQLFPQSTLIAMVVAESLSEMGDLDRADAQFAALARVEDPAFDAARMRHEMRHDRPDRATRIGARAVTTHGNPECWAWMGAALRATQDPRAQWFYQGDSLVSTRSIEMTEAERIALADLLRSLHRHAGPPFGQSPRGGTQTLGPLLKRREAPIVRLRSLLGKAVRQHIDGLPPVDPQHPCLRQHRGGFRFEGSWSILLRPAGHHVSHIHSHGWISSALYVDLPDHLGDCDSRKGWLQIGVPPMGGAGLDPLQDVEPGLLKLALFPSLFWHGTRPFDEGSRLTVAFDILPR